MYRSVRDDQPRQFDELDLPRRSQRRSHWGWETRTRHFVVFSTTSAEQAAQAAGQMERAWTEIGRLADQWTDVHRQPKFGIGAVSVWMTDETLHPQSRPSAGPRTTNYGAEIYVNSGASVSTDADLPAPLRREVFRAFLRVAGQDQVLPDWVQTGLASYVAGDELPEGPIAPVAAPSPRSAAAVGVWNRRVTADRMAPLQEDPRQGDLWVRYLLEGEDAKHAPDFFAALRTTVATHPKEPFRPSDGVYGVVRFESSTPPVDRRALEDLTAASDVRSDFENWLADPNTGIPVVEPVPADMPLEEGHREMLLILKLARRFATQPAGPIRPKVQEFGVDRTTELVPPAWPRQAEPLSTLYGRLTSPDRPAWATRDTDGSLLLSNDHERLAELLTGPERYRWRTYQRDGQIALEAVLASGEVIEAWLEDNPENPRRPIAHIERKTDEPPAAPATDTAVVR